MTLRVRVAVLVTALSIFSSGCEEVPSFDRIAISLPDDVPTIHYLPCTDEGVQKVQVFEATGDDYELGERLWEVSATETNGVRSSEPMTFRVGTRPSGFGETIALETPLDASQTYFGFVRTTRTDVPYVIFEPSRLQSDRLLSGHDEYISETEFRSEAAAACP